jgi:hypothetical protein
VLELQKANFEAGGQFIGEFPMTKLVTQWRETERGKKAWDETVSRWRAVWQGRSL